MLPKIIKPMMAATAPEPFDSNDYFFELKWDGVRCLAFVEHEQVRLQSRELVDITEQFPELVCLRRMPDGTVLDGELVVLESGKPSLSRIQTRVQTQDRNRIEFLSQRLAVNFMVFDVLFVRGKSVMSESLVNRRARLGELLGAPKCQSVKMTEGVVGRGSDLFAAVQKLGLEGVMAKRLDGPYLAGKRSGLWKKIKVVRRVSHWIRPAMR